MKLIDRLVPVLLGLAARINIEDPKPDLTSIVDVVGDMERLALGGSTDDVAAAQVAVARIREQLTVHEADRVRPVEMLRSRDALAFLAGALWVVDELFTTRLDHDREKLLAVAGASRRTQVRQVILDLLGRQRLASPTQLLSGESAQKLHVRPDEVSKVLGELLAEGTVITADTPEGADRRRKYYQMSAEALCT